jgi:cytochrome c oxidase subunit 2
MTNKFDSFVLGLSKPAQLGFQPAYSPIMEGIIDLHNYICFFLVAILIFVCWMLFYTAYEYKYNAYTPSEEELFKKFSRRHPSVYKIGQILQYIFKHYRKAVVFIKNSLSACVGRVDYKYTRNLTHWTNLEIVWTILPSFILLAIAIPSFILLYSMDELTDDIAITVKVVGHQWYWSYQFSNPSFLNFVEKNDPNTFSYDSYMVPCEANFSGKNRPLALRLLHVDSPLWLPAKTHIRLMITSADVIHSWAVPALGVKVDAVPGRINQTFLYINEPGRYFGQCSEICGANHGFMPIEIIALSWKDWSSFYRYGFLPDASLGLDKSIIEEYGKTSF